MWLIIDYQLFLPTNECSCSSFPWEGWTWIPAFLGVLWEDKNLQNMGANLRYPFSGSPCVPMHVCVCMCVSMHVCLYALCVLACVCTCDVHVPGCMYISCTNVHMCICVCMPVSLHLVFWYKVSDWTQNSPIQSVSSKHLSIFLSSSRMTDTHYCTDFFNRGGSGRLNLGLCSCTAITLQVEPSPQSFFVLSWNRVSCNPGHPWIYNSILLPLSLGAEIIGMYCNPALFILNIKRLCF